MKTLTRSSALELIQSNIYKYGHHIYLVSQGGALPRFAYTIGLSQEIGFELIMAGAAFYSAENVKKIINVVAQSMRAQTGQQQWEVAVESLGSFSLRQADASWANVLMLGALDFYDSREIPALQIVPDKAHWTLDVPDLSIPWSAEAEPVWKWLREPWRDSFSEQSIATTNLDALRGERITEAARWEENEWELFAGAGPDVLREDVRVVPLSTLLALDDSIRAVTQLEVGHALWRDPVELNWHPWGPAN